MLDDRRLRVTVEPSGMETIHRGPTCPIRNTRMPGPRPVCRQMGSAVTLHLRRVTKEGRREERKIALHASYKLTAINAARATDFSRPVRGKSGGPRLLVSGVQGNHAGAIPNAHGLVAGHSGAASELPHLNNKVSRATAGQVKHSWRRVTRGNTGNMHTLINHDDQRSGGYTKRTLVDSAVPPMECPMSPTHLLSETHRTTCQMC